MAKLRNPKIIAWGMVCLAGLVLAAWYYQTHRNIRRPAPPRVVDGVMDLTHWDFARQGAVMLQGQWQFYWHQLLSPADFAGPVQPRMTGYITGPGLWNGYVPPEGAPLGGEGYATYRALLRYDGPEGILGLEMPDAGTSYRLWVNGQLVSANGTVGVNSAQASPQAFPRVVDFQANRGDNEILLQVANFSHSKGGMWSAIYLGTPGQVQDMRERQTAGSLFLGGALLIMALYHLGLYLLRRKEKSPLFLAFLCLLVLILTGTTGEAALETVFPGLNWYVLYLLEYISFYLAVPVLVQFIHLLYPGESSRRFTVFAWGLAAVFSLTVLVLPATVYSRFILFYELYTAVCLLYLALPVLLRAALRRREGAALFLLGTIALLLGAVNDSLVANGVIYGPYITAYALFVFLLSQSFVLSTRFSRAFATVEYLSQELREALTQVEDYSRTLEQKVRERTTDLERARREADAASRAKSDFLAVMSHEIRTPMHAIVGLAELLQLTGLQAEQREYTEGILSSSDLMLSLINDILDFSRIEEGKLTLEEADFNLRAVQEIVSALVEAKARQKGLVYRAAVDPDAPACLRGDPLRLSQILLNLVGNAVKFTATGGVTLRVSPAGRDGDRVTVRFEVCDTGPGIPEEARETLFRPFTQADPSTTRRYGGTGLGLSICKRLVDLMGGEMGFRSEPGQGSVFWFAVPFREANAGKESGEKVREACPLTAWRENPGPVLVVEDSAVNRTLILGQLKLLGLSADAVENGREAVEAAARTLYAVVLMDCRMPEMDGFAAARAIRELDARRGGHTPILAVTAGASAQEREACLASGMDECLEKPLRLAELYHALTRWLPDPALPPGPDSAGGANTQEQAWLTAVTGGDAALLVNVVEAFLRDVPEKLSLLKESLRRGEASGVRVQAHALKSSGTVVDAARFARMAREMEELAAAGSLEGVQTLAARMEEEFEQVESDLTALLKVHGQSLQERLSLPR